MAEPTPLFDANLHPEGLGDQDLESMRLFGVAAALVSAHHFPQATPKAIRAHFDDIVGTQLRRLEAAGIRGYAALGVHPLSLPRRGMGEVLAALPEYFKGGKVVAVGAIGLSTGDGREEEAFAEQLTLAGRLKLPVLITTPAHGEKDRVTRRTLSLLRGTPIAAARICVDGASARTLRPIVATGHRAALTVHPDALSAEKALALVQRHGGERVLLDSGAGAGAADILALPRLVRLMERAEMERRLVERVAYTNAAEWLRLPRRAH